MNTTVSAWLALPLLMIALHTPDVSHAEVAHVLAERPLGIAWSVGSGFRQDDLQWTITGSRDGTGPNILSDLDWEDVTIIPFTLGADIRFLDSWHLNLHGGYGKAVGGTARDSDYDGDNRGDEFSRSYADADSSYTLDVELALGHDFTIRENTTLTPWVGISLHRQNLGQTNGRSVIDDEGFTGSFSGLDSTYDARWLALSLGLDARLALSERSRLILTVCYEIGQYEAEADWNLRPDLRGFTHEADARGLRLGIGYEWDFAPRWSFGSYVDWWSFETDAGEDRTRIAGGGTETTRLNGVTWDSLAVRAALTYRF